MDKQREKDIQELCSQVLNTTPNIHYGSNGDLTICPFCGASVDYEEDEIKELNHEKDCAYLIAKDLSTNGG